MANLAGLLAQAPGPMQMPDFASTIQRAQQLGMAREDQDMQRQQFEANQARIPMLDAMKQQELANQTRGVGIREQELGQQQIKNQFDLQKFALEQTQAMSKDMRAWISANPNASPEQADQMAQTFANNRRQYMTKLGVAPPGLENTPLPTAQQLLDYDPANDPRVAAFNEGLKAEAQTVPKIQLENLKNQNRLGQMAYENQSKPQVAAQTEAAKADVERQNTAKANAQKSNLILGLLDNVDSLIDKSTGSGIGAAVDTAAGYAGYSTPGAKAIAELTPLANRIVMEMPRGPGAQSDRDVELAKGMAADIANPSTPVESKKAALKGLRNLLNEINARQTNGAPAQQQNWMNHPDKDSIKAMYQAGKITKDQAKAMLQGGQ